jgi:hypothetical protein
LGRRVRLRSIRLVEDPKTPEEIIEEDLDQLELRLRQLKIEYDRFFNGGLKLPPWMLRSQVDRMVRRYANISMRNFTHRFRFNTMVTRYHAYVELWGRKMRVQEEGSLPGLPARGRRPAVERLLARTRIADPKANPEKLRDIYAKFVESQERRGGVKKSVSFDKFVRGIAAQAAQLQKSSGCAEIELRLVLHKDQVQLKARPGN